MKKIIGILIVMLLIGISISVIGNPINGIYKNKTKTYDNDVEWSKTYGGSEYDRLYCVQQTNDGGYIACGQIETDNNFPPWALKLDSEGNIEWEWILNEIDDYGGNYFSHFESTFCSFIQQTIDNGYLLCFFSKCWIPIGNDDYYPYWIGGIVKLNQYGSEEWIEFYIDGFEWVFLPVSFIELEEGGFIVTGHGRDPDPVSTDYEAGLMKIDQNGVEQWYQNYQYGDGDDQGLAICKTDDNGYLITGYAAREAKSDYWMIKTNNNGIKEWDNTFGGDDQDFGHQRKCFQTSDGGFIMSGYSYSYGAGKCDMWIVKTDSIGNIHWNKTYGSDKMDLCWGMEADDDGFVFCVSEGFDRITGDKADIHLVKTDELGNIVWVQKYATGEIEIGQYVDKTNDGGFIISGRIGKHLSAKSDGLLVKFAPFENQRPNKPEIPDGPTRGQPGNEYTFSTASIDPDGDKVYYKWDWGDGNFSDLIDRNEASYAWTYEGNFDIRVKAVDELSGESDWSDPIVFSTPKNKEINTPFLQFLKNHSYLFPLLQRLLEMQ